MVFKTDDTLYRSKVLQNAPREYFRPSLSYHLSLKPLFCLFLSGRLIQTGFTVCILPMEQMALRTQQCMQELNTMYSMSTTPGHTGLIRKMTRCEDRQQFLELLPDSFHMSCDHQLTAPVSGKHTLLRYSSKGN